MVRRCSRPQAHPKDSETTQFPCMSPRHTCTPLFTPKAVKPATAPTPYCSEPWPLTPAPPKPRHNPQVQHRPRLQASQGDPNPWPAWSHYCQPLTPVAPFLLRPVITLPTSCPSGADHAHKGKLTAPLGP